MASQADIQDDARVPYGPLDARPPAAQMGDKALWVGPDAGQALYQVQSGNWLQIAGTASAGGAGPRTVDDFLLLRSEVLQMNWRGPFLADGHYYPGDTVRTGGAQYVCTGTPAPRLDTRADTFTRADQVGWGTASDGNTWSQPGGVTPGLQAISSNTGTDANDADGNSNINILGDPLAGLEQDTRVRWSVVTGGAPLDGVRIDLSRPAVGGRSDVFVEITLDGAIDIGTSATGVYLNDSAAWAGGTSGTLYWTRCRIEGTTVFVKVWADGAGEPAGWNTSYDMGRTFPPGCAGILNVDNNPSTVVSFDSFSCTMLAPRLLQPDVDTTHWERSA